MTVHTPAKDVATRWQRSAIDALAPIQREMNRFMQDVGEGWDALNAPRLSPSLDVADTKEGFEVTVELPGLKHDDVKVTVEDDTLVISGEKRSEHERKEHNLHVVERTYGQFSRSIYLPRSVDGSKIKATMNDGVLKIVAPKRAGAETKSIAIQTA